MINQLGQYISRYSCLHQSVYSQVHGVSVSWHALMRMSIPCGYSKVKLEGYEMVYICRWTLYTVNVTKLKQHNSHSQYQSPVRSLKWWLDYKFKLEIHVLCPDSSHTHVWAAPLCDTYSVYCTKRHWSQWVHLHGNDLSVTCCTICSDPRVCLLRHSLFWDPWECLPA